MSSLKSFFVSDWYIFYGRLDLADMKTLGTYTFLFNSLVCSGSKTSLGVRTLSIDCLSESDGESWLGVEGSKPLSLEKEI